MNTIKLLKVRLYGDPCLRKKSLPVKHVGPVERLLIASMIDTMEQHKGVGLAAPQVGINERIIVVDIGNGPIAIINPQIVRRFPSSNYMEEGCLSIPGITVNIKRPQKILIKYINEHNRPVERVCEDLLARVVLHETDHLNGKLIVDYVPLTDRAKLNKHLKVLEAESKKEI